MKAVAYTGTANDPGTGIFQQIETEIPQPGSRDLLVQVKAVSVNPVDAKVRANISLPLNNPRILGWDAAGIVDKVGNRVSLFKPGDHVFYAGDINRPGSNSAYQVVDERITGKMPLNMTFAEAAAMPLTSLTAWEALFDRLHIHPETDQGKTLLIINGAGGVGSIAIQIAKKIAGLKVITTASRQDSRKWCMNLGADICLDHSADLASQFKEKQIPPPAYILCLHSTDNYFDAMASLIAPEGSICMVVGAAQHHNIELLKAKSARLVWEFMFTRSQYQTADMVRQHDILNTISGLLENGTLSHTMTENLGTISPSTVQLAHQKIESGHNIGKIVMDGFA